MNIKEIIYACFYSVFFMLSVVGGIITGFRGNSHTPPLPFATEFFALAIGFILLLIDAVICKAFTLKYFSVHIWGLIANGLVMAYIFLIY